MYGDGGGCYKHTFYNISSFQCMEMTPSLACANKCVFCWRHHTNPVARSFTWNHDSAEFLVDAGLAAHRGMIKQMKGVPGVQEDRLTEAMSVKHCALSLVGEPIIYPEISNFVGILHKKHISSFMVTNAQFPDQIRDLAPVTLSRIVGDWIWSSRASTQQRTSDSLKEMCVTFLGRSIQFHEVPSVTYMIMPNVSRTLHCWIDILTNSLKCP